MDIVERLRGRKAFGSMDGAHWLMFAESDSDCQDAAAEIERLRKHSEAVEAALSARAAELYPDLRADNARMRLALEELDQHASLGTPPWYVVPDHVIEKCRAAHTSNPQITRKD